MTRSLILFASTFVLVTGCGLRGPDDDYCHETRDEGRALMNALSRYEGDTLVYDHVNGAGTLRVEMTVDEVLGVVLPTSASNTSRHPLDRMTDLFVAPAHAACLRQYPSADVTYTVSWTPMGGDTTVLHADASDRALFMAYSARTDEDAPGDHLFRVHGDGVAFTVTVDSGVGPAAILYFGDDGTPEADVAPSAE